MVVTRPPMGWNSWNTFGKNINEKLIMETADRMVDEGLLDCGYNYLVIDDCWASMERDSEGRLKPDEILFPHGMKYVSDYVHSKGLKFGMYSCVGAKTCAGYPASYHNEFIDADTFAKWGVDYLKYDYCFKPAEEGVDLYRRMGLALANCGRDICFSACNCGADSSKEWIKTTGAHLFRSTGDIFDSFGSIKDLILRQDEFLTYNGQGCFNDVDMLVVGMGGIGNICTPNQTVTTAEEYRTHFSAWAMLGSPLMIGCDIRNMSAETKFVLMNKDIIEIDQDPAYRQPFLTKDSSTETRTYIRFLENGDVAVGMFNLGESDAELKVGLSDLGFTDFYSFTLHMKDLWSKEEFDLDGREFKTTIAPHCCRMFRVSLKNTL